MRRKALIAALSVLLLLGIMPGSTFASGPVPGCPPATHVNPILGPWDSDGAWFFPRWKDPEIKPLRLAIVRAWYNLNDADIVDHPLNPGQPSWDQTPIRVKISPKILRDLGGTKARMIGMGGEAYIYVNNAACRHNLRFEFRHSHEMIVTLAELVHDGLARVYD